MKNEITYTYMGDYYIPDLQITEETRSIGKWGRMHRDYLKEHHPIQYNALILSGNFWTYLADLNQQTQDWLEIVVNQLRATEGITEELKAKDPMAWVQQMNSIRARAEEIILQELVYGEVTV